MWLIILFIKWYCELLSNLLNLLRMIVLMFIIFIFFSFISLNMCLVVFIRIFGFFFSCLIWCFWLEFERNSCVVSFNGLVYFFVMLKICLVNFEFGVKIKSCWFFLGCNLRSVGKRYVRVLLVFVGLILRILLLLVIGWKSLFWIFVRLLNWCWVNLFCYWFGNFVIIRIFLLFYILLLLL